MRTVRTRIAFLLLAFVAIGAFYALAVRPWMLNWGSTAEERARSLPGDAAIARATKSTTRALTISTTADRAFPWVAQLGRNRGGFYSYELLEDLVGSEMPRATTLIPGAQEWKPGYILSLYPYDKVGSVGEAPLLDYVPGRALAFATRYPSTPQTAPPDGSWAFVIEPVDAATSRFLVRSRGVAAPGLGAQAFERIVFEPVHFVMERRMMEGIRLLAEGREAPTRFADAAEILAWAVLLALVVWGIGATLRRERWTLPFGITVVAALGFLGATFLQPTALLGLPFAALLLWALRATRPVNDGGNRQFDEKLRPAGSGIAA